MRFAPSVRVLRQIFPIVVHGISINAYKKEEQKDGILRIKQQNLKLHPGMEIIRFSWPWIKKKDGTDKAHSSLMLELATPEMANRVCAEGLIENYVIQDCETYDRRCRILQCFKCQQYGHMAFRCQRPTRCGHCGGDHHSKDHETINSAAEERCTVCQKTGHATWSRKCETRQREIGFAKTRWANRRRSYPIYKDSAQRISADKITIMPNKKRALEEISGNEKRGPGRPRKLTVEKDPRQTTLVRESSQNRFQIFTDFEGTPPSSQC